MSLGVLVKTIEAACGADRLRPRSELAVEDPTGLGSLVDLERHSAIGLGGSTWLRDPGHLGGLGYLTGLGR